MAELVFRSIALSDKAAAQECFRRSGFVGCEYTFANNFAWADALGAEVCFYEDFYFYKTAEKFIFPAGGGSVKRAVELILQWCAENDKAPAITANKQTAQEITALFDNAHSQPMRDAFDYVYSAKSLSELGGKRYHSKRNHIARFCENEWSYEPICTQNIAECADFGDVWSAEYSADEEMRKEICVVKRALDKFEPLGLRGGLLRVDGRVCAFTYGEGAGNVFVVHAEKALRSVQGAYAAINREFVRSLGGEYEYINREDDAGSENLRKAKLSYCPEFLEEKYLLTFGGTV